MDRRDCSVAEILHVRSVENILLVSRAYSFINLYQSVIAKNIKITEEPYTITSFSLFNSSYLQTV